MSENSRVIWDSGNYPSLILKRFTKIKKVKKEKTQCQANRDWLFTLYKRDVFFLCLVFPLYFPGRTDSEKNTLLKTCLRPRENNKIK